MVYEVRNMVYRDMVYDMVYRNMITKGVDSDNKRSRSRQGVELRVRLCVGPSTYYNAGVQEHAGGG